MFNYFSRRFLTEVKKVVIIKEYVMNPLTVPLQ